MSKKCFFICPIGNADSDDRNRSDKIMRHILNPICGEKGYEVIRADKINSANKISADIVSHLENDELAIADLTGHNPNVFYEIGYRKAKIMPVIHIAETGTELPFDTIDDRTIFYDLTDLDVVAEFKQRLSEIIDNLLNFSLCKVLKEKNIDNEEESYMLLFRDIAKKYFNYEKKFVAYAADTIDKNDIKKLAEMGYIGFSQFRDGSIKIIPTELGLKNLARLPLN